MATITAAAEKRQQDVRDLVLAALPGVGTFTNVAVVEHEGRSYEITIYERGA